MKYLRVTTLFFAVSVSPAFSSVMSALAQYPGVSPTKDVATIGKGGDLDGSGFSHANIATSDSALGNTALGEIMVAGIALDPAEVVEPTAELPTSGTPGSIASPSRNIGITNVSCSIISANGYVTFNISNSHGSASSTNTVSGATLMGGSYTPGDCSVGAGSGYTISSDPTTVNAYMYPTGCGSAWEMDAYGNYVFVSSYYCHAISPTVCTCQNVL